MKKTLLLLGLFLVANGMPLLLFGQNNNDENLTVLEYQDYKFFDDEPDYKLFEERVDWVGYTSCESTQKFYVLDNQQNVIEYDLKDALNKNIKKRSFHLPFKVETTSNTMEISPNGQRLAFVDEGGENLHIVDPSSGNEIASCKLGKEYANEKINNNDMGQPFSFLSNSEVLVSGARKALVYDIEKNMSMTLPFEEKYQIIPKTNVTSIGTISGWYRPASNSIFKVAFFVEKGKIEKTIENLFVTEYPRYYIYHYQNSNVEYYDKLTGNKIDVLKDYHYSNDVNSDMRFYCLVYNKGKKCSALRFVNLQGDASKYSIQQQEALKKYALHFNGFGALFTGWMQYSKIMYMLSNVKNDKKLVFFNHTLTDNEIAKQALLTAINEKDIDALDQFIEDFPESRYIPIAKQKKAEFEQMQLPLSASNKAKVYRTLPLVGAVAGEFYVGRFTGGTYPGPTGHSFGDREMSMSWTFDLECGRIGFSSPLFKGLFCNNLLEGYTIILGNGQQVSYDKNLTASCSLIDKYTANGKTKVPKITSTHTLYLPDYKDETIIISWVNTLEQTGVPAKNGYYTNYKEHNHHIEYTLPINVKEAKAYYFFYQAKKASLKDAIAYLKDCKNDDYRQEVENEIVSSKTGSISDIVYCNDNYPKLTDRLEDRMFGLIGSMSDCDAYLKYYSPSKRGSVLDDKVYQYVKTSNEASDCAIYLKHFPNGSHKAAVTAQKNEIDSYNAAKRGGKAECTAYLTKYPNGRFTSEIQTKKDNIVKEENRQAQIKINSNKGIWKLGNKLCNCTNDGIIMVTLDQWNEDKSMFKGIVSASPGGLFKGDLLQKGNAPWFETKDWHICLDDEVDFALRNDKSLEAEQLQKAKKMKFTRGTVVAHTYYRSGWFFNSSYRVKAKVDDWNDDYTRMKIQIIDTDGLEYIDGESIYEGKYIWVSPIGWE